ncbi:MAG: hypothetical protein F4229_09750 [Gammaproteobacteria bacterium]|nr:hypothetical protein [Gammaproteobacteria bacterium]
MLHLPPGCSAVHQ